MARQDSTALSDELARRLAAKGRGGDSLVAHINPEEARLLKARGGAGTINPKTGLLEFSPAGGQAGGSDGTGKGTTGGAAGKGARDNSQGGTVAAGAKQGGIGPGTGGGLSTKNSGAPQKGSLGQGGYGADAVTNNDGFGITRTKHDIRTGDDVQGSAPVSSRMAVVRAGYQNALKDYAGIGESFGDHLANTAASLANVDEMDPAKMGMGAYDADDTDNAIRTNGGIAQGADWGFDYGKTLADMAGLATGVPLGSLYGIGTWAGKKTGLLNHDFGVADLGPDVFGGHTLGGANPSSTSNANSSTASAAAPGAAPQGFGVGPGQRRGDLAMALARDPTGRGMRRQAAPSLSGFQGV